MGKKVQEMLDNANQRVPKVEVNQAMEWMNDETPFLSMYVQKMLFVIQVWSEGRCMPKGE